MKPCPRINISFLSTSFPRFEGDFSGNFVLRYAQELNNLGVDIEIIVPDDPKSLPLSENFSLVRFPYFFHDPGKLLLMDQGSSISPVCSSGYNFPFY